MYALLTVASYLNGVHTRRVTLDSVVSCNPDEIARAIEKLCDCRGRYGTNAEVASKRVVVNISLSAPIYMVLPFDSVSLDCVTAVFSIDEFIHMRVNELIEHHKVRLFVVEHGSAGVITRSLPPSCIMPSSLVADGVGLEAVARRLCSKSDLRLADGNPRHLLMFSSNPTKRRFTDYTGRWTDIGFGISSFSDDDDDGDDAHAYDPERRRFRNILCLQTAPCEETYNSVLMWQHRGVSPAALFPFLGALPAICAVAYGSRVARHQIMRTDDLWHSTALSMCLSPPHPTLNCFSSISRQFQLHLQLVGGMSHMLLRKLGLQSNTRARSFVACKVASSLARDVFRCFNEEADGRWVVLHAMLKLWEFVRRFPPLYPR